MFKQLRLTFFVALALLAGSISTTPSFAEPLETVKVAQFGKERFLLYLPLYIAMEQGYFAENGLEVELVFAGNDDQIFAAVAGGAADFGVGDPVFTAIAQEKGFEAKTVALMITSLGISGYTNNPDIPVIKTPQDLAGLRIGSFPKPSTTYTLLEQLIDQHPETLKDTAIIEAGFGAQLALLEADRADIAIDLEPNVSKVEQEGYRVVFNLGDYTEPQAITGLVVTQEKINTRPNTVQATVDGLQKALYSLHTDRSTVLETAQKIFPDMDAIVIKNAVDRMLSLGVYPKSVEVKEHYWQRTLASRLATGELTKAQPTKKSVDNQFARRAVSATADD